jgi:hypothetical protein
VHVEGGRRQFVEDKDGAVVVEKGALGKDGKSAGGDHYSKDRWDETHETKREDGAGRDRVGQHANTKDVNVVGACEEIPEKVASCQTLQETQGTIIAPNLSSPVHLAALLIVEDDPDGRGID